MLKSEADSFKIEKPRSLLIPGLIVIFVFASGFFLIQPRIREIFSIQKNLKKEEKRLAQLTAKTAALEGLDQVELSEKAEITAKSLPSEKDLPLLLSVLKNLAAKNNLELRSLEVDPGEIATASAKEKEEKLPFLSFEIVVGGQMSDFKEFLTQVAQAIPLMRTENINLEVEEMGGSLKADLFLGSPYLFPPATLGLPEKPLAQITSEEEEVYHELSQFDFSLVEEELPSVPAGKENLFAF